MDPVLGDLPNLMVDSQLLPLGSYSSDGGDTVPVPGKAPGLVGE